MRLADGDYPLQPQLQRWRDICEEAELWDDKTIISTVLRGGRYQVLGFRAVLQTRGAVVDGGCLFRMLWQPEARRLVLNTLAFAVDASCRGQGIGTRLVGVLGLMLRSEVARATVGRLRHSGLEPRTLRLSRFRRAVAACSSAGRAPPLGAQRLHGDVDDSMMLVDALEPDFYAKRGFDKSVDAAIVAAEIRQWLTNEGTPKELRTLTLLSTGNHVPKMIRRWGWQKVPDPAAVLQRTPAVRARGDDETPPVLTADDVAGEVRTEAGEGFSDVRRQPPPPRTPASAPRAAARLPLDGGLPLLRAVVWW